MKEIEQQRVAPVSVPPPGCAHGRVLLNKLDLFHPCSRKVSSATKSMYSRLLKVYPFYYLRFKLRHEKRSDPVLWSKVKAFKRTHERGVQSRVKSSHRKLM